MCQAKEAELLLSFAVSDRIENVKAINNRVWNFMKGDPIVNLRAQTGREKGKGNVGRNLKEQESYSTYLFDD